MNYEDLNPQARRSMFGWFGTPWNGCYSDDGVIDEAMRIPVPVGRLCSWCEEPFTVKDSGKAIPLIDETTIISYQHRECLLRAVVGGLDHLAGRCTCHGGISPDGLGSLAEGMTAHQEALAVDEHVARHGI